MGSRWHSWIWALLTIGLLALAMAAASTDVQDIDEAIYAEIAHEMVVSGDWIHPQKNYRPYFQHPPFAIWLIAASYSLFGVHHLAARLPALLAALLGLVLTWRLGARLFSRRVGWLASLILVTSPGYFMMVKDARLDMVLVLAVLAALLGHIEGKIQPRWYALTYIAMGLAVLTKGPVGALLPAAVIALDLVFGDGWAGMKRSRPWVGVCVVLAIAIPWYAAMTHAFGRPFLDRILLVQSLERFFSRKLSASSHWWFYLRSLSWMFLPWFLPLGIGLWRRVQSWRHSHCPRRMSNSFVLVLATVVPVVLFSLSRSQLDHYVAPALPGAALLAAQTLETYLQTPERWAVLVQRFFALIAAVVPGAMAGVLLCCFASSSLWPWVGVLAAVGAALGVWWQWRSRPRAAAFLCVSVSLLAGELFLAAYLAPQIMRYQPARHLAAHLPAHRGEAPPLLAYKTTPRPALVFYSGREVLRVELEQLREQLETRGQVFVVTRSDTLTDLMPLGSIEVLTQAPMFHTSRPSWRFLNRTTRPDLVRTWLLVRLRI